MRKWLALAVAGVFCVAFGVAHAGTWKAVATPAPFFAGSPLLLMNGDVMIHDDTAPDWWILRPDASGSYVDGSWHQIASLPVIKGTQYAPLYYASAVLPDGKVLIMGGEYNGPSGDEVFTNLGAIYDPRKDKWRRVDPPSDDNGPWPNIGDVASVILSDGTLMLQRGPCLAACNGAETALFDEDNLSWIVLPGTGMTQNYQDEQGYTLLPDGTVLTIDVWDKADPTHAEKFLGDHWVSAGDTTAQLDGGKFQCGTLAQPKFCDAFEVGPAVLRADGTVIAFGAAGANSIYVPPSDPAKPGTWVKAPSFPKTSAKSPDACYEGKARFDVADGPAALLPNGNVLVSVSPGVYCPPLLFYELTADGKKLELEPTPAGATQLPSFVGRMLELPTGQILYTYGSTDVEIYTPDGSPDSAWAPAITTMPNQVARGTSFKIAGTQLNGLSQGAMYGDDAQTATNYPLVRVTSGAKVYYCTTANPSTMGVATGDLSVSVQVNCGRNIPAGNYGLEVVANGIASPAQNITLK